MSCVAQSAAPEADDLTGRRIGDKYEIEAFLRSGAMGAIYRARHLTLDKTICVKILHRALAFDRRFAQRFQREAMAASRLDHPGTVRIIDYGEEPDGLLYIAMEYLDGRELLDIIHEEWPLGRERTVDIVSQILAALAAAHDAGILHRDLKPENIMIVPKANDDGTPGELVKVCDFGIAKVMDSETTGVTTGGMIVGTPEYMSPEQVRGEPIDARSDLYAVGVLLYHVLTGRRPFESDSAVSVVFKHMNEMPLPPSKLVPDVDRSLETICLRALAKSPAQRWPSARAMRAALQAATFEVVLPLAQRSGIRRKALPPESPPPAASWWTAAVAGFLRLVRLGDPPRGGQESGVSSAIAR